MTDRCAFLDVTLYVTALMGIRLITKSEYKLYCDVLAMTSGDWIMPNRIVVLIADPETILQRIQNRGGPKPGHYKGDDPTIIRATNSSFLQFGRSELPSGFWPKNFAALIRVPRIIPLDTSHQTEQETIEKVLGLIPETIG